MNLKRSFAPLLCLIILSSCARVKITDREFCADMGPDGASCFTTLTGTEREINPNDWEDYRLGMICSKADTFAEWKKAIAKLCRYSRRCTFETKKKINRFGQNIEEVKVKIHEKNLYSSETF